jgi:hypothetical protein
MAFASGLNEENERRLGFLSMALVKDLSAAGKTNLAQCWSAYHDPGQFTTFCNLLRSCDMSKNFVLYASVRRRWNIWLKAHLC